MKIVVCIRQGRDGEINPFDACAYELALGVKDAEVTLLSMGVRKTADFLLSLTRLGAKRAILLCDPAFAGADTQATSYTLSLAIHKLKPDYVFCGRQTLEGDTAQTGPMLSVKAGFRLITNVMGIEEISVEGISCRTREEGEMSAASPALITVERINTLRLPGLRSKTTEVLVWDARDLKADPALCGLAGSPTRVIRTFENAAGKRKCKIISPAEIEAVIEDALRRDRSRVAVQKSEQRLDCVMIVGESPREYAATVTDHVLSIAPGSPSEIAAEIDRVKPDAVLWGSDSVSKRLAAQTAAILGAGLCADCTALETEGNQLFMIRPALAGSVIAKIKCTRKPAMATVRTVQTGLPDIFVAAGFGAREDLELLQSYAERIGAGFAATRKMVDRGFLPYQWQVGLTGITVSPAVYIAVGISGAVHHIVGMKQAGTVIAVNPDPGAPIFEYADYGVIGTANLFADFL